MSWVLWIALCFVIIVIFSIGSLVLQYRKYQRDIPKPPYRLTSSESAPTSWSDSDVSMMWIGHSTVLINLYGLKILTDPVFSERVGVRLGWKTIGPKRHTSPAVSIDALPDIDLILVSHAHMDHVDLPSLKKLASPSTRVVTAHGTSHLLKQKRFSSIYELGGKNRLDLGGGLTITAVPVKHWGNRFPWNRTYGYTGYLIEYRDTLIFFAGDTAYTPTFDDLRTYGEIDVAMIPIGAYAPDSFQGSHCTPEQAWSMFLDTGAKWMAPIHWDTFVLSQEPVDEPMQRLLNAAGQSQDKIVFRQHGDVFRWPGATMVREATTEATMEANMETTMEATIEATNRSNGQKQH